MHTHKLLSVLACMVSSWAEFIGFCNRDAAVVPFRLRNVATPLKQQNESVTRGANRAS